MLRAGGESDPWVWRGGGESEVRCAGCWPMLRGGGDKEFAVCGGEREVRWEGRWERGEWVADSLWFGDVRFGEGVVRVRRGAG